MLFVELAAATLTGVISHLLFFIRGEHHIHAPRYVQMYLALFAILLSANLRRTATTLDAFCSTFWTAYSYAFGLFTSMVVYRLYFHKLRHFPGPTLISATKFYHMWHVLSCKQYLYLESLRQEYGDFVRTGSSEITIFTRNGIEPVLGSTAKCTKAQHWDMMWPEVLLLKTRSKSNHDSRRRIRDRGFSISGVLFEEFRELNIRTNANWLQCCERKNHVSWNLPISSKASFPPLQARQ